MEKSIKNSKDIKAIVTLPLSQNFNKDRERHLKKIRVLIIILIGKTMEMENNLLFLMVLIKTHFYRILMW